MIGLRINPNTDAKNLSQISKGKKGDPFYNDPEKKSKNYIHNIKVI